MKWNVKKIIAASESLDQSHKSISKAAANSTKVFTPRNFNFGSSVKSAKATLNVIGADIKKLRSSILNKAVKLAAADKNNKDLAQLLVLLARGVHLSNNYINGIDPSTLDLIKKNPQMYIQFLGGLPDLDTYFRILGGDDYGVNQGTWGQILGDNCFYDNNSDQIIFVAYNHLFASGGSSQWDYAIPEFYETYWGEIVTDVIPVIKEEGPDWENLVTDFSEKYHMSKIDVLRAISAVDSQGACSYAAFANSLIGEYRSRPDEFQRIFGYPLYDTDSDGNVRINNGRMLLDLYVNYNTDYNPYKTIEGSPLADSEGMFYRNSNGELQFNPDYYTSEDPNTLEVNSTNLQNVKTTVTVQNSFNAGSFEEDFMAKYGIKYQHSSKNVGSYNTGDEVQSDIKKSFQEGKQVRLIMITESDGPQMPLKSRGQHESSETWGDFCHTVSVTDADSTGIVISSWGQSYKISYSDLFKCNESVFFIDDFVDPAPTPTDYGRASTPVSTPSLN